MTRLMMFRTTHERRKLRMRARMISLQIYHHLIQMQKQQQHIEKKRSIDDSTIPWHLAVHISIDVETYVYLFLLESHRVLGLVEDIFGFYQ
mmetsp:Transcript_19655/g.41304  ORF Transcript_19655/g.41304 Transcript_19655/m.41304 type:complete len:91 (-) Transcript_19655:25-297(-)